MSSRVLVANPKKCTGCGLCRIVCAMEKSGIGSPVRSRIRVVRLKREGQYLPVICQHCQDAPCMTVCPQKAIHRDDLLQKVTVDYDLCISCKMCLAACPFGAIGFDSERQTVFKCDHCNGDPKCVQYCFYEALEFVEDYRQQFPNIRIAALQHAGRGGKQI